MSTFSRRIRPHVDAELAAADRCEQNRDSPLAFKHLERAHVLGHWMGGSIAQALALSHPHLLDKLILAATNFGGPHHIPITPEAMAVLTDVKSDTVTRFKNGLVVSTAPGYAEKNPAMIETWLAWRVQNPIDPVAYQAQLAIGLALLAESACFEGKLKQVTAPTSILFGAHDQVVPPGNAELLAREIPHSTIELLPHAGPFLPIEPPDAAHPVTIKFLKGQNYPLPSARLCGLSPMTRGSAQLPRFGLSISGRPARCPGAGRRVGGAARRLTHRLHLA